MAGSPKSITIGGIRFKIPSDCTPNVVKGGRYITESQTFGDGTSEPVETVVAGKITGIVVSTTDSAYASLMSIVVKKDLPIVLESATKTYECTGFIVKGDGIENDTTKDKTSEFEIHSQSGPIRES